MPVCASERVTPDLYRRRPARCGWGEGWSWPPGTFDTPSGSYLGLSWRVRDVSYLGSQYLPDQLHKNAPTRIVNAVDSLALSRIGPPRLNPHVALVLVASSSVV